MKKVFLLTLSLLTSLSMLASGKSVSEAGLDCFAEAKYRYIAKLKETNLPKTSSYMKSSMKAEAFSLDLAGMDKLVLITDGGEDGSGWDHAVWAEARLFRKDGSYVWLDDIRYAYGKAGEGSVIYDKNADNEPIRIAGKGYDHAIFCHADGVIVYDLPKDEYVRFEALVGIDDSSSTGSVRFIALNELPDRYLNDAAGRYPKDGELMSLMLGDLDRWMKDADMTIETGTARQLASGLDDPSYFLARIKELEAEKDCRTKIKGCIRLIEAIIEIRRLQTALSWIDIPAIQLAYEDMCTDKTYDSRKYGLMLNELASLTAEGFAGIYREDTAAIATARKALELKRSILLANPLLDSGRIVAARYRLGSQARTAMAPQLGTQSNNWSNQMSTPRDGFDAEIVELSDLRGKVSSRTVYRPDNGSCISDLRLHWDGDRMMFTQTQEDRRWNIFEVKLDGSGFRKIIENEEPDLDFYDGTYLPDGRILAVSNIGYQGVPCVNGDDPVGNLVLYDPSDRNMRRLTFDQDANWNPVVMNNGKVMYTRWEYTDLTHYYSRIVMHMNPDGTENKALYGSGAMFPNSIFDVQPLPGNGTSFIGIISGHHGIARSGRLLLFDPSVGRKSTEGVTQEIPHRNRPVTELIKDELVNGVWPQFVKPSVLDEKYFLVAAKLSEESLWGIYLVDIFDNVTCIIEAEDEGFISPVLVRKTVIPPALPDRVKLDQKEATFFIQDIYEGEGLRGIPRGTVKEVRIHAYEYAYVKSPSDHNWHGIQSGWDIKRNLGTAPVEEDGSVIFKAPANTPLSIQPLDKEGVAVQWMRSWVTGQPGEIVSCIGCHESQNQTVIPKRVLASQREPHKLKTPEGGVRSFTFDLEIQPILDRTCISCHNGDEAFDLRGGRKDGKGYGTSYLNLHPYVHRQGGEGDMVVLQPYEYHPNTSELVRMLKRGHHNVTLTDKEWRTLYNWIDYNAPDKGYFIAEPVTDIPYKGHDQMERRIELTDKYGNGAGVDWKQELADYAAYLAGQGEIVPERPEPVVQEKAKELKVRNWPFDAAKAKELQEAAGETRMTIEIAPGINMNFVRIPSGSFVMGSCSGPSDTYPETEVKIGKAFWMGELEVTNEQYNIFFPEHDSRYVDQQWKDHVVQGYPANLPDQPVIRVSYEDAMEFCRKLSRKIGKNVTLPTEAQWEWACRAGSDTDFWYGDMGTDFGSKDNLADRTTLLFAVIGIDPQPMSPDDGWYPYYTYLPKDEGTDDSCLVQTGGIWHEANPFGLYYMHGNVCEWTRSDYIPYPYKENSKETGEYKVVRGGSFIERPKFSTSYSRKGFYPYQRVFNVGFRVIIED
ncbi:MAG: SUMF1/EgtB/PvdO family nonheme iron enzyme [Bacteroidales bacterium]|nr:SUMF1/EgtB/PvdO family nonheme iron enzyme [Bacteroidales bacterium]